MNVYTLQVLRDGNLLVNFEIDEKTIYSKILMGDHVLPSPITIPGALPLAIGDYVIYKGRTYILNKLPDFSTDEVSISYDLVYEPRIYTLYDKKFKHLGAKSFTYFGNLFSHLTLLISNINEIDLGWTIAFAEDTEEIYISYDKDNCRTALTKIAAAFNLEYDVDERAITVKKSIGQNTGLSFEVGMYKGLYSLKRQSVDDSTVVTRAYGYGGTKNIDHNYRNASKELIFPEQYLEKNVDLYPNAKEEDYENDQIFPNRTGSATGVSTNLETKIYTLTDSAIDFDLNLYKQESIPRQLVFKSGELSGSQFEIVKYDHPTKTITYKEFKDTNDYALPNTTYKAAVGDQYTLVDINMPQSYIDAAEAKLKQETQDFLDQNSIPRVIYQLDIDEKYVRDNNIQLAAGDYITVKDARLGINGLLRISAINWPLVNEAAIQCTISNFILDNSSNRLINAVKNAQINIKSNYVGNILESRRQTSNLYELRDSVFDPLTGYFKDGNIRPNSIETLYLSVGAKANDFNLSEVVIKPNLNGDSSQIELTSGRLLHNSISIGSGFIWVMSAATITGLISNTRYYVYAKCSKSSLVGTFVVSATQIKLEDVTGYYHFNMGVLYPVKDGYRDFEFTKGMAYLVGDTLTAGKIKSIDAQTYWDLTQGQFKLGGSASGIDWNVTTPDTLTLRGAIVQNPAGVTAPISLFRGAYQVGNTYFKGESVSYNGSTWTYMNSTPGGSLPTEGANWTESAKKGSDGTSISIKGSVPTSSSLPNSGNIEGDGYITDDTGHLWMWNGSEWGDLGEIRGPQGEQGQQGVPGANGSPGAAGSNGLTPYLHVKYSNDGGVTFTGNSGEDPGDFRGEYVDYTPIDSGSVTAYTWAKIKGDQGVQGPAGPNGQTLYTWIKYADNVSGGGMSVNPTGKTYIGIAYNKTSSTMSNTASDYAWSLYQGPQGVQGVTGADGQPTYTWVKYADDAAGTGLTDDPTGKMYLGLAYNKNTQVESLTPGDYSWSLIKGAQGVTPRILYAKNGSPDTAPSLTQTSNPSGWSLIAPTTDDNIYLADNLGNTIADNNGNLIGVGISAEYLWQINESINTAGVFQSWSTPNRVTGRKATAADFVEVRFAKSGSPTVPPTININESDPNGWTIQAPVFGALEYLWKIYGEKYGETKQLKGSWNGPYRETAVDGLPGKDGINGTNGINGSSSYFHVRYSPNANGSGMGTATNTYIGTVVTNNPTAPTDYTQYAWVRLIGAQGADGNQGIPGTSGTNGQTSYLHIKYSNDGGATFTASGGETPGDYIGQYADFVMADSSNVSDYTWSLIKGAMGATGPVGPLPTGGDVYDSGKTYTGTPTNVSIVRYNDGTGEKAYVARVDAGTFSGVLPTNASKWNAFGGQYESVATKLFFAELALVKNLAVENLKTKESGRRMEIIGDTNSQTFYDASDRPLTVFKDDVDTFVDDDGAQTQRTLSGMNFNKYYSSNPGNPDIVKITGNGIYANTGSASASLGFSTGRFGFGSLIGYIRRAVDKAASDIHSSIIGLSAIDDAHGGFFKHMANGKSLVVEGSSYLDGETSMYGAQHVKTRLVGSNYTCIIDDYLVLVANFGTTKLPVSPKDGRIIKITNITGSSGTTNVAVNGNGKTIRTQNTSGVVYVSNTSTRTFIYAISTDTWEISDS